MTLPPRRGHVGEVAICLRERDQVIETELNISLDEAGEAALSGHAALEREDDDLAAAHRAGVNASAGAYPDAFTPDHLDDLRADWPA